MPKSIIVVDRQSTTLTMKRLNKLKKQMGGRGSKKAWNDMLTPAAQVMKDAMTTAAPEWPDDHKLRGGKVVKGGHLKRSMWIFKNFRESKGIFVGPRVGTARKNAYYAPWSDTGVAGKKYPGTRWVDKSLRSSGSRAMSVLKRSAKVFIAKAIRLSR